MKIYHDDMTFKEKIMYVFSDYNTGAVNTEQAAEMVLEIFNKEKRGATMTFLGKETAEDRIRVRESQIATLTTALAAKEAECKRLKQILRDYYLKDCYCPVCEEVKQVLAALDATASKEVEGQ